MAQLPENVTVTHGAWDDLPRKVKEFTLSKILLSKPDRLHIIDGTVDEEHKLEAKLCEKGTAFRLTGMDNCYVVRTNPADVARVESKTLICSKNKHDTIPHHKEGVNCRLGQWRDPDEMDQHLNKLFDGCMKGRTMYLIPFSMGPVGSPLSKIGIQLTDSPYVAMCMRIMTRMGSAILAQLKDDDEFVRATHSVGQPLPLSEPDPYHWPCNPEKTVITHFPERHEIISFGSGYGGNSLLGKKCFALRIASILARDEGWMAEHMMILGLTNPEGKKRYIAAAFPSACGKTNLAMLTPTIPGWKAECVGDDIAWMKFDEEGNLRAINPEYGFFGVAPGTSMVTNPNALKSCQKNTVFTNTASTSDGRYYWEGLEKEVDITGLDVTDWHGNPWKPGQGTKCSHPNARFCAPAMNCPVIDPNWEDPKGVVIEAILFGGRRPEGVPLIYETRDWTNGVFTASSMCSEATFAAEHKGNQIMRDPFAMRPFFGYNAGQYIQHWLDMEKEGRKMPRIYHVNWFRVDHEDKSFLWPGFCENCRVLKWICERLEGKTDNADETPVGYVPKQDALDLSGLDKPVNMEELVSVPKEYWLGQLDDLEHYYKEQFGEDLPQRIWDEFHALKDRFLKA